MAKRIDVPPPAPFAMTSSRASTAWTRWTRQFDYYVNAAGITLAGQKKALLLHIAGPEVQDLFETLTIPATVDDQTEYDVALSALNTYFSPTPNIAFERHQFRQAAQRPGESVDEFCTRLKSLAASCAFSGQRDEHIRDQFVDKCSSSGLRRRLLREPNLTLTSLMDIARASQAADQQAAIMEGNIASPPARPSADDGVNVAAQHTQPRNNFNRRRDQHPPQTNRDDFRSWRDNQQHRQNPSSGSTTNSAQACTNCDFEGHQPGDPSCPARGRTCRRCQKIGHFGRVCRSSRQNQPRQNPVHAVDDHDHDVDPPSGYTDEEYNFQIHTANMTLTRADIEVDGHMISMIVDSGATANIIDVTTWNDLHIRSPGIRLTPSHVRLFGYGSRQPLPLQGEFKRPMISTATKKRVSARIVVVDGDGGCLLGRDTAIDLGLLSLHANNIYMENANPESQGLKQQLVEKYPEVFDGVGKLKDFEIKVHVKPDITPVAQPPRRIPFHLRKKVDEKLQELKDMDIIEPVSDATTWASPLVVVPKSNGDVRVCVDMRRANEAIIRERHPIPTLEETLESLNGAAVFSKLDLKWGYHQVELAEDSRNITTFVTHNGIMRYKRLIFGLSSASEIYQYAMQQALQGLEGVKNISDDIIVFGANDEEHDRRLESTLERLRDRGLTLNQDKCVFRARSLKFFGFVISEQGLAPDQSKIDAIRNAPTPTTTSEVRSFLGLVNYCGRFIRDLATISEPLRELTRGNATWKWTTTHQTSFDRLKNALSSDDVMAHFDTGAGTELRVDASPVGLGAILLQTRDGVTRPVAYASRTLTSVERRYSQTEKEALAVVWGCERFHLYLYGVEFDLITDHKPLEYLYTPRGKPHARIERWVLRLQQYQYKIKYMPGKTNPADVLSRLPLPNQATRERAIAEDYINAILTYAIPCAMSRNDIASATTDDHELQRVISRVQTGKWDEFDTASAYYKVRHELALKDGILLRGTRIVMPRGLRQRTLDLAHETHQGIVRTKQLLRTKVWWPNIDEHVEKLVKECRSCQLESGLPSRQPLEPTVMPPHPWHTVHVDLCGPLPTGETLLVVVDNASRWPEVEIMRSTTTSSVISRLDRIFANQGLPVSMVTDNGPQFISAEFKSYVRDRDIEHRKVTPYHPQANAEVERFNATIMKGIRAAINDGRDWHRALPNILLTYRSTVHPATNATPAKLLLGRELRTKVPSVVSPPKTPAYREALKHDATLSDK